MRRFTALAVSGLCALLLLMICAAMLWGGEARGGFRRIDMGDGGGGYYVNLIMREVKVTPIRAHVGDVIRVDVVIEDQSDVRYDKGDLDLFANGRRVASKRYGYEFGTEGNRIYRDTLLWNTKGIKPGEYRIRAEFFVWGDASEFDNFLDVREPLVLLPPGEAFRPGEAGGAAFARDPRYKPASGPQGESARPSGGY